MPNDGQVSLGTGSGDTFQIKTRMLCLQSAIGSLPANSEDWKIVRTAVKFYEFVQDNKGE